ncbi:uncharacterized protein Z518_00487 [Rhinocladiella mackenziei CBS 650.93]|uniref:Rhinocladiella mackenziei CBS 650.93 unplaced genomic scaffold supercont1.1, whole genome shotgun sequence n=1 Tax=Rhinocladiella mackenziei CBS 650.93 TaxID=1442369 RepID=A0A0D2G427_9EURO|nr:uncharacterized protein Z518_00487 [Rhinocladiella mackenziei CBS 650.93]KIX09407.1 hypothetical protein Z518_00487 [Rhinocladiella mackenziei CBS 650.93]
MVPASAVEILSNPLTTSNQLVRFRDFEDDHSRSIRFAQGQLTSAAGILLRLSQEVIAHAIVLLQRFLLSSRPEDRDGFSPKTYSAASIYVAAKTSATPVSPRSVINVYAYLISKASPLKFVNPTGASTNAEPLEYFVSEGTYERERQRLFVCESMILAGIGFDTRVALPYGLAMTYLQALGVSSPKLSQRVFEHLNGALLSPQFLYLTHQPNALAVGAIYLAARETGVKLAEQNWWEVFDVDREDLGFLVLAYGSLGNFANSEMEKWKRKSLGLD